MLSQVSHLNVRWLPAPSPIDLPSAREEDDPFPAQRQADLTTYPDAGPNDWRVLTGDLQGNPRPVLANRRLTYPYNFKWDAAGISLKFQSMRDVPVLGQSEAMQWNGTTHIDPVSGSSSDQFDAFPSTTYSPQQTIDPGLGWMPRDDHGNLLSDFALALLNQKAPANTAFPAGLYQVDPGGSARRLDGVDGITSAGVKVGGHVIVATTRSGINGVPPKSIYLLPSDDGDAIVIQNAVAWASETVDYSLTSVHPPNNRILFLLRISATDCCDAELFDPASFSLKSVGHVADSDPAIDWFWYDPRDTDKFNKVRIGDQLFDVTTGQVESVVPTPTATAKPSGTPTPSTDVRQSVSPSGRYVVTFTSPNPSPNVYLPCAMVTVLDTQTGTSRTASDTLPGGCLKGYRGQTLWWDDGHLGITLAQTDEGQYFTVNLLDAAAGTLTQITGKAPSTYLASQHVSPDGKYVLINGERLWLYASSGQPIQAFDPPPGLGVWGAGWSPDSLHFAYLLGPAVCVVCTL